MTKGLHLQFKPYLTKRVDSRKVQTAKKLIHPKG